MLAKLVQGGPFMLRHRYLQKEAIFHGWVDLGVGSRGIGVGSRETRPAYFL